MDFLAQSGVAPSARRTQGFTLVELLVTLALVAALAALALPSLRELIAGNTLASTANELMASLAQARAEAVKRGVHVALIARSNSGDWSSGWDVRADSGRNSRFESRILAHEAPAAGYRVTVAAVDGFAGRIVFTAEGELASGVPNRPNQVDLNICRPDRDAGRSRHVRVQASGEASTHRGVGNSAAPPC